MTTEEMDKRLEGLSKDDLRGLAIEALERSGLKVDSIVDFIAEECAAADLEDGQGEDSDE